MFLSFPFLGEIIRLVQLESGVYHSIKQLWQDAELQEAGDPSTVCWGPAQQEGVI